MPDEPTRGEMPFLDHLEELRWRILYSLLAVFVTTLVGWFIVQRVDVIGLLIRPIAPLLPGGKLRFTSPTEPFFITLKVAFAVGLLLASPIVVYQIWAFLAPALYERERRLVIPALSVGVVLILAALGLVTPQFLARNRRYAVVVSAVAAALLSPPDAVSMVLMMIPLWLLYEVSILCAWIVTRRRARRTAVLLVFLGLGTAGRGTRSEEHTSELQSRR